MKNTKHTGTMTLTSLSPPLLSLQQRMGRTLDERAVMEDTKTLRAHAAKVLRKTADDLSKLLIAAGQEARADDPVVAETRERWSAMHFAANELDRMNRTEEIVARVVSVWDDLKRLLPNDDNER